MEMQSKNKASKNSTAALIYFLLKSDIERALTIPIPECKIFIFLLVFLSSLSIAQETDLLN
jgi:hypothetical protein